MIEITPLAAEKLSAYLSDNKIDSAVRITAINGYGGPSLGLALDECQDSDHVLVDGKLTLVIDQRLSRSCGMVKIDYVEQISGSGCGLEGRFSLTSAKQLPRARGGRGGSRTSNGCVF